jgi:hypothetical protein
MKTLALQLILMLAAVCRLQGGISTTLLIPQPIVAFGDAEDWTTTGSPDTDEMYMILHKPRFEYCYNGPVYKPIAEENIMEGTERDCNLLSLYKIKITQEFMSKDVILDLSEATPEKDSAITLEIAGYAALECIRMVANRYHHEIAVSIVAPVGQEEQWLSTQRRFAAHDKSKPFKRKEHGVAGQPAARSESESKSEGKPQPEPEGRSR